MILSAAIRRAAAPVAILSALAAAACAPVSAPIGDQSDARQGGGMPVPAAIIGRGPGNPVVGFTIARSNPDFARGAD